MPLQPEGNKCHCKKPAKWMLRIVALHDSQYGHRVLSDRATDMWAVCGDHIGEAAIKLLARQPTMEHMVLTLREEEGI